MPNNEEGTFWGSLAFWRTDELMRSSRNEPRRKEPGKSRKEQAAAARMAYKRKEGEMLIWKKNDAERREIRARLGREGDSVEFDRDWWDCAGFEIAMMSPVVVKGEGARERQGSDGALHSESRV